MWSPERPGRSQILQLPTIQRLDKRRFRTVYKLRQLRPVEFVRLFTVRSSFHCHRHILCNLHLYEFRVFHTRQTENQTVTDKIEQDVTKIAVA